MTNASLKIDIAENGFVVYEGHHVEGMMSKIWAFESAETLADFIRDWGVGNTKKSTGNEKGVKN